MTTNKNKNQTTTKENERTKIAKVHRLLHDLPYTSIITKQIKTDVWTMVEARVDDIYVTIDIVHIVEEEAEESVYSENIEIHGQDRSADSLYDARDTIIDAIEGDNV